MNVVPATIVSTTDGDDQSIVNKTNHDTVGVNHIFHDLSTSGDRRRIVFNNIFRDIQLNTSEVFDASGGGFSKVLTALYFFVYQYLNAADYTRCGRLDDPSLRVRTLQILNDCIRGDYNSLYEMIYR